MTCVTLTTANTPGAVAILQLHGGSVVDVLQQLTGRKAWPERRVAVCKLGEIDEGLAVVLGGQAAQLMPHGGPRVVQKLIERLTRDLGCVYESSPDPKALYPEARSPIEADMLDAVARAASPAAVDLLAQQPRLWPILLKQAGRSAGQLQSILEQTRTLDRLLHPPTVVVVGPANVGKSTLTNALLGKTVSLVADLPGTTRDWVGALVELTATGRARDAVAVNWLDTPGLRESDDPIERRAIALAKQQIEHADVLIAMRAVGQGWPDERGLPRPPDLWVVNKVDDASQMQAADGLSRDTPLTISAIAQSGLAALQSAVIRAFGLDDLSGELTWAFSTALRDICDADDLDLLQDYLGPVVFRG